MSLGYSVGCRIRLFPSEENIKTVLKVGKNKLMLIYNEIDFNKNGYYGKELSIAESANALLAGTPEPGMQSILAIYQDTHFCFTVYGYDKEFISIQLCAIFDSWNKSFNGKEEVDIARYAKLILDLVEGMELYDFYIEDD